MYSIIVKEELDELWMNICNKYLHIGMCKGFIYKKLSSNYKGY